MDTPPAPQPVFVSVSQVEKTVRTAAAVAPDASASKTERGKEQAAKSPINATPHFTSFPINIGTIPAGDSVTIIFTVTVNAGTTGSVSNPGTVSGTNFTSPVSTNDPETVAAGDATVTNIQTLDLFIRDARVAGPSTGQVDMLFTVALSSPAPTGGVSYQINTANGGSANPASGGNCGTPDDYVTISGGNRSFAAGEQVKVITISVCADDPNNPETDETFLVNVSNITGAQAGDAQATGTITVANPPGCVLISELRTSGPGRAGDDFVELYNNQDVSQDISGWAVVKSGSDCTATPVIVAGIPATTTLPPRGHYLVTGRQYSLGAAATGNLTVAAVSDIESDRNLALFNTSNLLSLSTATREDAVGFNANTRDNCALLQEGANVAGAGGSASEYSFVRKLTTGLPSDPNASATGF